MKNKYDYLILSLLAYALFFTAILTLIITNYSILKNNILFISIGISIEISIIILVLITIWAYKTNRIFKK